MKRTFLAALVAAALLSVQVLAAHEHKVKRTFLAGLFAVALLGAQALAAHEHKPPHHGTLVCLGDEFAHLELVLEPASGRLTAYALDGEAERPVRLKARSLAISIIPRRPAGQPFTLTLRAVADPLSGETVGDTSEFHVSASRLQGLLEFDGQLVDLRIRGRRFHAVSFNYPRGNEALQEGAGHAPAAAQGR